MKLTYQALDKGGRGVTGAIDAADGADAIEQLRRRGLFVTEITAAAERGTPDGAGGTRPRTIGHGKRLKALAMFARQLQVLVATGIPVTQALEALERQVKPGPWKDVLTDIRSRVEQGTPLSDAMTHHPGYFDSVCRSMVEAGETGGNFVAMLERLAALTRKQLAVRNAIVGAMVYPTLLMVVAVSVLIVLLTFVLPRFAELFKTLDTPLPPSTKVVMAVSDVLRGYWWVFVGGVVGGIVGTRAWLRTTPGRRAKDTVALRVPKLGAVTRNFATARLVRTLGVLLQSKVSLLDALRLTRIGTPNVHYAELLGRAEGAVTRGDPISTAFSRADLINPGIYEALRNGERSGQVGPLLLSMADFMDEENEVILRSLTSIIEPLILIVLGAIIGLVALSMFMPLFDLTAMTRGGGA